MRLRPYILPLLTSLAGLFLSGCGFNSQQAHNAVSLPRSPSQVVRKYLVLAGERDRRVENLYSEKLRDDLSSSGVETDVTKFSAFEATIPTWQGIKSVEIRKEDITGNTAEVIATFSTKNGLDNIDVRFKLVKEDGEWKLDAMNHLF